MLRHGSGPANNHWKGGRNLDKDGYIRVLMPDHPRAARTRYVLEHILVVEKVLGKYLRQNAVVHHRNEIRADNRNCNLIACENVTYHRLIHTRMKLRAAGVDPRLFRWCPGTPGTTAHGPVRKDVWGAPSIVRCRACVKLYYYERRRVAA